MAAMTRRRSKQPALYAIRLSSFGDVGSYDYAYCMIRLLAAYVLQDLHSHLKTIHFQHVNESASHDVSDQSCTFMTI